MLNRKNGCNLRYYAYNNESRRVGTLSLLLQQTYYTPTTHSGYEQQ